MTKMVLVRDASVLAEENGRRLFDDGMRALPDPYGDETEEFMPAEPCLGRCRICGTRSKLTREHIPPAAAFNLGRGRLQTVEEWLRREGENGVPRAKIKQGGIWAYTLCKPCNGLTGARYGDEYRRWAGTMLNMVASGGSNVRKLEAELDTQRGKFTLTGTPAPRPGAVVRQVLAMMCSVSGGFNLAGRYPIIRRMILEGTPAALPAGMSLGLTVYLSTRTRLSAPMLTVDTARGWWRWTIEVAHAPLASLLVIGSTANAPPLVYDISEYTRVGPDEHKVVEGRIEIGFGNTVYPGDYRTKAAVEAQAGPG